MRWIPACAGMTEGMAGKTRGERVRGDGLGVFLGYFREVAAAGFFYLMQLLRAAFFLFQPGEEEEGEGGEVHHGAGNPHEDAAQLLV